MKEPKGKYDIRNILVLSTAHLTKGTAETMDGMVDITGYANPIAYGYFMHIPHADHDEELPEEVKAACRLARELGCTHLRYDCDGKTYSDLDAYDW